MPDVRIVGGDQNHPPITAATVLALARANALVVTLVNASGDVYNAGGGAAGSGGDGAILDGSISSIKATVKSYTRSNPLAVTLVNFSGDVYNTGTNEKTVSATGGRISVNSIPTLIMGPNPNRLACSIQNVERQQMFIDFSIGMSAINAAFILPPTINNSGDGGFLKITGYLGPIYGVVATGDGDVRTCEF